MNIGINQKNNINFGARCPQVRDAEWVCRVINQKIPHYSLSKQQGRMAKYIKDNFNIQGIDYKLTTANDIYDFIQNYAKFKSTPEFENMMDVFKNMFLKFSGERYLAEALTKSSKGVNPLLSTLFFMTKIGKGNCGENALIAELIMKMNGFDNARSVSFSKIKKGVIGKPEKIDHIVCAFNKDNSPLNGKISSKTIFIDPWIGKADFAKNMERYYTDQFSFYFPLKSDEIFEYEIHDSVKLSERSVRNFKEILDDFIFRNAKRKFMQGNQQK